MNSINSAIIDSLMTWARTWCSNPRLEFFRDTNDNVLCEVHRKFSTDARLTWRDNPVAVTRVQ